MTDHHIEINQNWCKSCMICVDFCPKGVLSIENGGKAHVTNLDKCTGCRMCEFRCPDYAIKIGDEKGDKATS